MELPSLDPAIHQRTRLQIMALLNRNRDVAIAWAREQLDLTYGNLYGHVEKLEEAGYVERRRRLTPDGFEVRLRMKEAGAEAFSAYLRDLRAYLETAPEAQPPSDPDAAEAPR